MLVDVDVLLEVFDVLVEWMCWWWLLMCSPAVVFGKE